MNRSDIKTFITSNYYVQVTFTKKDGTERNMLGTREATLLPQYKPNPDSNYKPRPELPDICKIYDVANKGWRSFNINSVTSLIAISKAGETEAAITEFVD